MQNPLANFIGVFSLVRDDRGFQVNPLCRLDITSPFPPSGNGGYVRNLDDLSILFVIHFRAHFHQMGRGLPGVFGKRRVPCVRAGLLSRCLETLAWIRAQGSHHALPRSGGEPASTALGGGRSSLSVAVSRKSIAHMRGPHLERQKL